MLDRIVRYLHQSTIAFRLASYASPEPEPKPAHTLPPGGMLVTSRFVLVDGRLVLACVREGDNVDLAAIGHELGGTAIDATPRDVPDEVAGYADSIPPLGKLLGHPLIVDEAVESCAIVVFRGFGNNNYFEVGYDGFALLEQPRIASFARAGELEEGRTREKTRQAPPPGHG